MKVIEHECVGCASEMGCNKNTCRYWNSAHYYCDNCGDEEQLYEFEGEQLCLNCIESRLEKVE